MRINLIGGSAYSTTGGIQAMNRQLVRELGAAGLLRQAFFLWDDAETAGAEGARLAQKGTVRLFGLKRLFFAWELILHAFRHPGDVWLCTHVNYAIVGLLVSFWRPRRVAVMLHAVELDLYFGPLKAFALRRAGLALVVSRYTGKKAIKLGVRPERVQVLLNGVDDPCPDGQPIPPAGEKKMVLFVGRMDERYKGQLELLDAMQLLSARHPDLQLVFVGGGRSLDEWKVEARTRDLADQVEFTGRISDERLQQIYDRTAVFAMPSENEGFGLVYAEAMAHGVPCIGSDRDAAGEVIVDGETGFCVPAGNSTALADAISTLLKSPALREKMGRAGRRRFEEKFTASQYRRRLLATMRDWQTALPGTP